jgi:hypothetical protein
MNNWQVYVIWSSYNNKDDKVCFLMEFEAVLLHK